MDFVNLSTEKLIDICLEYGMPPSGFHYKWNEYSKWQIESLIEIGLKPENTLLDVGCGPLRLGVQAINYLNDDNYCGMDASPVYCKIASLIATEAGIKKKYNVMLNENFQFSLFAKKFDFAIAQSVFTHLSKEQIYLCFTELKKVMNKGGLLLFTNIPTDYARGFLYFGDIPMISGSFCTLDFYKDIAKKFEIEFIEKTVNHPSQTAHLFKF